MLPTTADGTPLCSCRDLRDEPHAWVKLWKHHAAQPEADRINAVARPTRPALARSLRRQDQLGVVLRQVLQILDEAPDVYAARRPADRGRRLGRLAAHRRRDAQRVHGRLQGDVVEGARASRRTTYFAALDPGFADSSTTRCRARCCRLGERAGGLTDAGGGVDRAAARTAVAVANVDAHVAVPAASVTEAGRMVMIMGTSTCHMVLAREERAVPGMCGYVEDGILPGFFGYEAGQSAVGDHLRAGSWSTPRPTRIPREAAERGIDIHALLQEKAAGLAAASPACWRSTGGTATARSSSTSELSGLLIGATLATTARRDLPRAHRGDRLRHARDHRDLRGHTASRSTTSSPPAASPRSSRC